MSDRTASVVTVSDRVSAGRAEDRSGPTAVALLESAGLRVVECRVIPDGTESVAGVLTDLAGTVDLIVTTGGTGLTPRDLTPEGTRAVLEREAPGLAEAMRAATFGKNPHGMLSRGVAGTIGSTLVVNLPGSVRGVEESLAVVLPALAHGLELLVHGSSDHNG
ncbi:MAG: MogA/MoaB family molybdenum cofactor biosynthesis protein [Actinomycetota bacterium]|nr:MogA/MoaB family molybdenum cofactor biosynthesis protein [Actinomycetota bacterium]